MEAYNYEELALRRRIDTRDLLSRVVQELPSGASLYRSTQLFYDLLRSVAARCSEIDDPQLNHLMLSLTLYTSSDPSSPDYDPERVEECRRISEAIDATRYAGELAREINFGKGGEL